MANETKDFKFTMKSKSGKTFVQEIVTFGSKEKPFPADWKENGMIQMSLQEYKQTFFDKYFDILIEEGSELDELENI